MSDGKLYPPLAALRAFDAVARLGGIRRAGKELGTDHAVVSRHIRALEGWVGATLLVRDGTGYSLTKTGKTYHRRIESALGTIASATGALLHSGERTPLRIWCIPGFAFLYLSDRLGSFVEGNPDIDLDFRPADDMPDFRAKEIDGVIRYLRTWDETAVPHHVRSLELVRPTVFPVTAPALAATLPRLSGAADLLGCTLLHEDSDAEWRQWFVAQGVTTPDTLPGTRLWHAHLTLNAARQGQGIALANPLLLGDDLDTGKLVRLQPHESAFAPVQLGSYRLMAREDRWSVPGLSRFRRWLTNVVTGSVSTARGDIGAP